MPSASSSSKTGRNSARSDLNPKGIAAARPQQQRAATPLGLLTHVGSVGEPRDGDPRAAHVICDLAEGSIELRRVPFDNEKTQAKLQAAGLPCRRRPP